MAGNLLLDTSAVIDLFDGDPAAEQAIANARGLSMASITLGELLYGAECSSRPSQNRAEINEFASSVAILSCDAETASQYGSIKHLLRQKGKPLPENDLWIAAVARQHRLTLVTRDAHFKEIPDFRCFPSE